MQFSIHTTDFDAWAKVPLELLKVRPDRIWEQGQPNASGRILLRDSGLTYFSNCDEMADIEEQLDRLLERVRNAGPALQDLTTRFQAAVTIVVYYFTNETPPITLRSDQVAQISGLRASLDVDTYVLLGDDDENSAPGDYQVKPRL